MISLSFTRRNVVFQPQVILHNMSLLDLHAFLSLNTSFLLGPNSSCVDFSLLNLAPTVTPELFEM